MKSKIRRYVVTLVHGTFAADAVWIGANSDLSKAIVKSLDGQVTIKQLKWSGWNLVSSRVNGAKALQKHLTEMRANDPEAQQVVIGHSHGGSVIAYALKRNPLLASSLAGCAFLSTPFLSLRAKPDWRSIAHGLGLSAGIWLACALTILFLWMIISVAPSALKHPSVAFAIAAVFAGAISTFKSTPDELKEKGVRLREIAEDLSTVNLPKGRYAFFRASGDEAAGVLSVAQTIIYLLGRLNVLLATPMRFASKPLVFAPLVVLLFLYCIANAILIYELLGKHASGTATDLIKTIVFPSGDAIIVVPIMAISALLCASVAVAFVWLISSLLASLAFASMGRIFVWTSLYLDIAVEPLPIGSYTLWHHGWTRTSGTDLSHSATYSQPVVIDAVCAWLKSIPTPRYVAIRVSANQYSLISAPALVKEYEIRRHLRISAIHPPADYPNNK